MSLEPHGRHFAFDNAFSTRRAREHTHGTLARLNEGREGDIAVYRIAKIIMLSSNLSFDYNSPTHFCERRHSGHLPIVCA